jgi:hypothetical protein
VVPKKNSREEVDYWSEAVDYWSEEVDYWSEEVDYWSEEVDYRSEKVKYRLHTTGVRSDLQGHRTYAFHLCFSTASFSGFLASIVAQSHVHMNAMSTSNAMQKTTIG